MVNSLKGEIPLLTAHSRASPTFTASAIRNCSKYSATCLSLSKSPWNASVLVGRSFPSVLVWTERRFESCRTPPSPHHSLKSVDSSSSMTIEPGYQWRTAVSLCVSKWPRHMLTGSDEDSREWSTLHSTAWIVFQWNSLLDWSGTSPKWRLLNSSAPSLRRRSTTVPLSGKQLTICTISPTFTCPLITRRWGKII